MSEANENAPLIASPDEVFHEAGDAEYTPAKSYFERYVRILTWVALCSSIFIVILAIATFYLAKFGPFRIESWMVENNVFALGVLVRYFPFLLSQSFHNVTLAKLAQRFCVPLHARQRETRNLGREPAGSLPSPIQNGSLP